MFDLARKSRKKKRKQKKGGGCLDEKTQKK